MNVLLTVNHSFELLEPLCAEEPVAKLPVAGKIILEHILEAMVALEADEITVAASGDIAELRHLISDGERWGLNVNIVSALKNESAKNIYERCTQLHSSDTLIVPCDRIFISSLSDILSCLSKAAKGSAKNAVSCLSTEVVLISEGGSFNSTLDAANSELSVHKIHTPTDFHFANLNAITGKLGPLKIMGKQAAVGLKQGYMTRFHPRCVKSGHVFIGNHCRVHSTCKINGPVVISHGVSIDRMTSIENSVVLDNSIIGEHLNVTNAIISGSVLIRVDTGSVIDISDKFLLASRGESFFTTYGTGLLNRIMGLIFSILTFPVLLIAMACCFCRAPSSVLKRMTFVGNKVDPHTSERQQFDAYVINDTRCSFRYLPMLLSVISGDINLFGISPLTPEEQLESQSGWDELSVKASTGLIGPTQLYVGMNAPLDERLKSDVMSSQSSMGVSGLIELTLNCMKFPFVKELRSVNS